MNRTFRNLLALPITLTLGLLAEHAYAETEAILSLTVTGIKTAEGSIYIGLFTNEGDYDANKAIEEISIPVDGKRADVVIRVSEPGQYAIKLFHDVDNDGELELGPMGIPQEPYGFSNNARGFMGPAKWKKAHFEVSAAGTSHTISLK